MKLAVSVTHKKKLLTRMAKVFSEIVMTNKGYANRAVVTVLGDKLHGFVANTGGIWSFWQESHPDFCDECGRDVSRASGKCRNGHLGPILRRLQDSGSPYRTEE